MGRNPKFSKEIKIKACQDYRNGKAGCGSIAKSIGADEEVVRRWCSVYEEHGEDGFAHSNTNRSYPKEFKEQIIKSYMSGQNSMRELSAKHNVSVSVLSHWIQKEYNGIEQTDYKLKREIYTMKSRKTTFQERVDIVNWILENNMKYAEAADRYGIRYSLLYRWVRMYEANGAKALEYHKRGPKGIKGIDESIMSETERLTCELERERDLRKQAEFQLEVLKKKAEIEKRLHSQK